jgi:hypothetical protein
LKFKLDTTGKLMVKYIFDLKIYTLIKKIKAFRAVGRLLGSARDDHILKTLHGDLVTFTERAQFDTQG